MLPEIEPTRPPPAKQPEAPPNIAEFGKWLGYHFTRDWPMILKYPIALSAVITVSIFISWLFIWHVVVPEKNEQLNTKQGIIESKQDQIDHLTRERDHAENEVERLSKRVEDLRIYRASDAPPLKKKALILAKQIRDFTKGWKDTDPDQSENVEKYRIRFGLRASIMRDDLDQNGQQDDEFDNVMYHFSGTYKEVRTIAAEIEKLANKLPD